jgi:2-dehydropantoate 2-reductase
MIKHKSMNKASNILVVGTGGIGGSTAVLLAKAGYNISVICKYPDLVSKIEQEGLFLKGVKGEMHAKMPAYAKIKELEEKQDLVLLATKATDMPEAARQLLPFLHENSLVVSLQNGICEPALAEIIGAERVVGCVVGWGATMLAPGELEITSTGEFVIGAIDASVKPKLPPIQKILSEVVPVEISDDIIASLYSKLIINSCITSLGAICGLYLGEMLSRKYIRNIFIQIMEEAVAVANAKGLKLPPYANKINYYKFLGSQSWWGNFKRHLLIRIIGYKYRRLKSSSLQSLERGKPTEIDFLNGYIVAEGEKFAVPTPVNKKIVQLIKEIEKGERSISEQNLKFTD